MLQEARDNWIFIFYAIISHQDFKQGHANTLSPCLPSEPSESGIVWDV